MKSVQSSLPINKGPLASQTLGPMIWTIVTLLIAGLTVVLVQSIADRSTSLLLAFACVMIGGFTGFLFGIPKVVQPAESLDKQLSTEGYNTTDLSTKSPKREYQQQVNTNLEQISDWLTKIIVGLGLVNLYKIPPLLESTSIIISQGISLKKSPALVQIYANALILYFPILGFMVGYLITRIFLSGVFREADTNQMIVGGQEVTIVDIVKNLVKIVTDPNTADPNKDLFHSPTEANIKEILWVDDNPQNNSVEREALQKRNYKITEALSTEEATSKLAKDHFDIVISDMGRMENNIDNPTAGLDLLQQMQTLTIQKTRIVIYCSTFASRTFGSKASELGAEAVVDSPQALLRLLP